MKKLKILLYGVLSLAVAAGIFALKCRLSPIKIYEMPINAWKRPVYSTPDSTQRQEFFVIYNYLGKSEQRIRDSIMAYNDRTISPDTIRKYKKGYYRAFYKRDWTLNKHYKIKKSRMDQILYLTMVKEEYFQFDGK